ncbi:MAG TPA: FAD-binding oxidoreductase [Acidimicrobiales bacterium]|nr:FAD-binding oxidoreductase [Acidimicrobiales bacterium]
MAERRRPTFPVPLAEGEVRNRVAPGSEVGVPDDVVARLRSACAEVSTEEGERTAAGRDWWPLALTWAGDGGVAGRPAVVVRPAAAGEVAEVLRIASGARVPVTPAAGRSGVCGGAVPVFGGVALDLTGLAGVVAVDDESLLVDVRAGTWGDDFEAQLRERHGLTLGHWPQSIALSTVGGWVACRSAGQYSTRYGKIEDMVAGLEVALADGTVVRTGGAAPRAATGPDLTGLFVGSEGALGVVTEARLRVHPQAPATRQGAWGFPSFAAGLDVCRRILRRGATPAVLRLYDDQESARVLGVDGRHVLLVLDEAEPRLADAVLHLVGEECARAGAEPLDVALVDRWLEHRNDVGALFLAVRQGIVVDTCEIAARWSALPGLHTAAVAALRAVEGCWLASAHQSHAYPDGACLYLTFAGRRETAAEGEAFYREAWDALMGATLAAGGAISHHHGIGLNRARFLPAALGPGFAVLAALKSALDPAGILNPGTLALPSPIGAAPWP